MSTLRRTRLDPATFALPVEKMRDGYYSDAYFTFTRDVMELDDHRPDVLMQVFQRERSVLGGIDEALAILEANPPKTAGGAQELLSVILDIEATRRLEEGCRLASGDVLTMLRKLKQSLDFLPTDTPLGPQGGEP